MTIPWMMNCDHQNSGWCTACVSRLGEELRETLEQRNALLEACKKANSLLDNLLKAVPWGATFDLDIALLNEVLLALPHVIALAKGEPT